MIISCLHRRSEGRDHYKQPSVDAVTVFGVQRSWSHKHVGSTDHRPYSILHSFILYSPVACYVRLGILCRSYNRATAVAGVSLWSTLAVVVIGGLDDKQPLIFSIFSTLHNRLRRASVSNRRSCWPLSSSAIAPGTHVILSCFSHEKILSQGRKDESSLGAVGVYL